MNKLIREANPQILGALGENLELRGSKSGLVLHLFNHAIELHDLETKYQRRPKLRRTIQENGKSPNMLKMKKGSRLGSRRN